MAQLAYVNGRYCAWSKASVSIFDRGYVFADGVYEVCAVFDGVLYDAEAHWARLGRSLEALHIDWPMGLGSLIAVAQETIRRNRVRDGLLYLQISRGVAPRDHAFPMPPRRPALVMTAKRFDFHARQRQQLRGVGVITLPDQRWRRVDIKSVSLLPNVLAKQQAHEAGAYEPWLVDDEGCVTEGSSTNAWIVTRTGVIVTHPEGPQILSGVMRETLLHLIGQLGLPVELRPFSVAEAMNAAEAFLTSTSAPCLPVVSIDGVPVGTGTPGPVANELAQMLWDDIAAQTGWGLY
jgi:D-alanine transaminase